MADSAGKQVRRHEQTEGQALDDPDLDRRVAALRDDRSSHLRLRAAYMYFVEGLTQSEVADRLGIGRVTVVRYLNEVRKNREVRFWIEGELADCVVLERRLEIGLGLDRAIVVPSSPGEDVHARRLIGFSAGMYVSEILEDGVALGVGWGQTLHHALDTLSRQHLRDASVVSLLGGISHAREHNPSEFAWRVASAVDADCYLFTAPVVVDSIATKTALLERCGLDRLVRRARSLDIALVSVGAMNEDATTFRYGRDFFSSALRAELIAAGAIGDLFFNFFDERGDLVDHPLNERVMSVPIECVKSAGRRVLVSGGPEKAQAILVGCKMVAANVLITDERTAVALLDRAAVT